MHGPLALTLTNVHFSTFCLCAREKKTFLLELSHSARIGANFGLKLDW